MAKALFARITGMPANNGSPITGTEAQVNGTAVEALGATAPGDYLLPGADAGDEVKLRSTNANGALDWAGLTAKTAPGYAPEAQTAPTLSSVTAHPNGQITVTPGTYDAAPAANRSYAATLNGSPIAANSGSDGLIYDIPGGASAGQTFEVVETAGNGEGADATQTVSLNLTAEPAQVGNLADLFVGTEDGIYYDVGAETGLTVDNALGTLTDLGPRGHDAVQATGTSQPVVRESNGLTYIETDGQDDWMRIPGMTLGSDVSMLFLLRNESQTATGSLLRPFFAPADQDAAGIAVGDEYYTLSFTQPATSELRAILPNNGSIERMDHPITHDETFIVVGFRKTGTVARFYIDGALVATGTLNRTSGFATGDYALFANPPQFGQERAYRGDFISAFILDRELTDPDWASATTAMGNKIGKSI